MNQERIMKVLQRPHISEKSALIAEGNQLIFRVVKDANKQEIKAAVELMFQVKVADVRVLRQKGKAKKFGQMMGKRSDWKKAYIRLMPGQELDIMNRT